MGNIVQLDEALSNKIAAGEVVERPASVVKELAENAIDANSSIIEIEIEEAGLSSIRIIDNGDGILSEDVKKAFHRHATSKIKDENDLFRIRTLGFRGEALPSIASVSKFEMKTSTGDGPGTKIMLEGGLIKEFSAHSSRKGTDLLVSDLFYNTPARLKYMKTIHTELGNITDVVNRLALSHPEVSFRLTHNGKRLLHTNGNGDVRQVLAAIYGINIAKKMIPITGESLDFTINGYIALPEITRASRNYITTMINGRFIKNYPLAKAISDGFHTLLPIGRYPIVLLSIQMDPILVDVNVHPAKMEVRLSKELELNQLVTETIKSAFKERALIPNGFAPVKKEQVISEQTSLDLGHVVQKGKEMIESAQKDSTIIKETLRNEGENHQSNGQSYIQNESTLQLDRTDPESIHEEIRVIHPDQEDVVRHEEAYEDSLTEFHDEANMDEVFSDGAKIIAKDVPRVPVLYPIGQMHGTYIFAQNENGLYIIDQHAAQERIKYEYFSEKVGRVENELQEMLVPITLEFSNDECIRINENMEELERVGIFLEEFGYNSFIVRAHPQWFPKGIEQEIIEEMIEQLVSMKKVSIGKLREEAAILMSCKASIKANRHLRNDEIQALLDELRQSSDPFTCPHGRPIIIHYSGYDMEKMFKRVM
ncbi:DNA mismatch repair endonuclease MutL [Peribacillus loiseleuriae]|uniref:DNA mismatch repair protein MutL n=1 Tax=Peribacillus loiseleuriae TaxID=1679170 RepID=A0A0K9GSB8_9BACI|nr:DNA mismatch repair endonuclease MutL [Peribacillus loiseleuriae]KMY49528.1 DNA mismatch repair protein MutL [Peribacillus loiseleuriae]